MLIEFSLEARAEFEDGERYYERQVPGLGQKFRNSVREALIRLRRWPLAAPVERDRIYIIAVAEPQDESRGNAGDARAGVSCTT